MKKTTGVLLAFFVCAVPATLGAWGFDVHRFIMSEAIPLLPAELRPFYEANRTQIVQHAVDPDLWRTAGWLQEPPRHFVDMDAYGPYPFSDLPHDEKVAVEQRGREFVDRNGTLPWRTAEIYGKLVEAFRQQSPYARENIKFFSSILAHYVGDAHVPFHAVVNYDGQLTGQWGIHSRFESELFERYHSDIRITPVPLRTIGPPVEEIFSILTQSYTYVQPILDADRAAVGSREYYDDEYFTLFFGKVRPILERRLSEAVGTAASFITSAWIEAGRPALPVDVPRTPRPVRRDPPKPQGP